MENNIGNSLNELPILWKGELTMAEYIDRDELICKMNKNPEEKGNLRAAQIIDCILEAPVADVSPVICCKYCIHRDKRGFMPESDNGWCHKLKQVVDGDFYCKYGADSNKEEQA